MAHVSGANHTVRLSGVISIYDGRIYYSPSVPEVDINSFTLVPYQPIKVIDQVEHEKQILKICDGAPTSPSDTARVLTVELIMWCRYAEKIANKIYTNPNRKFSSVEVYVPVVYANQKEFDFIERFICYFLQSKEIKSIPPYAVGIKNIEKILTDMIGKDAL